VAKPEPVEASLASTITVETDIPLAVGADAAAVVDLILDVLLITSCTVD
jgi:hypothetical protein